MRRIVYICYCLFLGLLLGSNCFAQVINNGRKGLNRFIENDTILNNTTENIVKKDLVANDGQIRTGMFDFWEKVKGVITGEEILTSREGRKKLIDVVKGGINYVLGFIGLIALLYIIYHGISMLLSPGDDAKMEAGRKAIRYGGIAIIGMGIAWFIVSIIFSVIGVVIDAVIK